MKSGWRCLMLLKLNLINNQLVESDERYIWMHLENPSQEEMSQIAEKHEFPLDYLYSTLDPDEVSRSEVLDQSRPKQAALISLLYPIEFNQGSFINRTLSIILKDDFIITCVKETPDFIMNVMNNQYKLIDQARDQYSIAIELIWHVTRSYVLGGRTMNNHMDELYSQSRKSTKSELLYRLADLDKSIIYMSTAIHENEPILNHLNQVKYIIRDEQNKEWLHDILVENHQAKVMINQTRQILEQLNTTFSSMIQNNLNEIMKILTSLTIIITIPTIVASFWGMNVGVPFQDHPFSFVYLILITVLAMAITIYWLKKKDLL